MKSRSVTPRPHIIVCSPLPALAYEMAADLESRDLGTVEVRTGGDGNFRICHAPGMPAATVRRLLSALQPLRPEHVAADNALSAGQIVVHTGELSELTGCSLAIRADSPELLARAAELVESVGMRPRAKLLEIQDSCQLHH